MMQTRHSVRIACATFLVATATALNAANQTSAQFYSVAEAEQFPLALGACTEGLLLSSAPFAGHIEHQATLTSIPKVMAS
jgi:hypothetical protein